MPIEFTVHQEDGYYTARFLGIITDETMLNDFRCFFDGPDWIPGFNELADISEADVSQVTSEGVERLASIIERVVMKHDIHMKVAVYAPHDLPYGLSRIYSVKAENFELHRVFRDLNEAREWIEKAKHL